MKKYLSLLCALALITSVYGCSDNSESSSSSIDETASSSVVESSETILTDETSFDLSNESTISQNSESAEDSVSDKNAESSDTPQDSIASTSDYVSSIGQQIEITDITTMAAEMINAVEGTSFKYNGNKFEIYRYDENDPKLIEASSGTITLTIEGFGDFSSNASVNGNYVMIYDVADDTVIQIFSNIN